MNAARTLRPLLLVTSFALSGPAFLALPAQTVPAAARDTPAALPAYDVVSIKPVAPGNNNMSIRTSEDAFTATNISTLQLITNAYNIREDLVFGAPGWVASDHFSLSAKVDPAELGTLRKLPRSQRMEMLQSLLADRFHLKTHIVVKQLPTYDLVVAKGGPRLVAETTPTQADPDAKPEPGKLYSGSMMMGNGNFTAKGVPVSVLLSSLESLVERNIIDKTGLTGKYDFSLTYTPEDAPPSESNNAPTLFTALQEQLGLRLQPSTGPVETLVIDHIEKPTAD